MRYFCLAFACILLWGCSGRAWNTTLTDTTEVRSAMLSSIHPGLTTEGDVLERWGRPVQIRREGAQVSYVYRNMSNPGDRTYALAFGDSRAYVIIRFQYGIAIDATSNDLEGCRATFPPRPVDFDLDTPNAVFPVNCGATPDGITADDYVPPSGTK